MATPSKAQQHACQRLRHLVRFRTAGFHLTGDNSAESTARDTAMIEQATRLYTETWIMPIIDALEKGDTDILQIVAGSRNAQREQIGPR